MKYPGKILKQDAVKYFWILDYCTMINQIGITNA